MLLKSLSPYTRGPRSRAGILVSVDLHWPRMNLGETRGEVTLANQEYVVVFFVFHGVRHYRKHFVWWGNTYFGTGENTLPYRLVLPLSVATTCVCCAERHSPHTRAPRPSHSREPAASCAGYRCPRRHVSGSTPNLSIWRRSHRRRWAHGWRYPALPRTPPCTRDTSCCSANLPADTPDRSCGYKAAARGRGRCPDKQSRSGPAREADLPTCLHPYSQPWLHGPSSVHFRYWQNPKVKWYNQKNTHVPGSVWWHQFTDWKKTRIADWLGE